MPTKKPRLTLVIHDRDDYARISKLMLKEYKSVNEGLRAALNSWLKSRGEEPLKELEWGGNRTGTKGGKKK
jgi:hypothetical protein